MWPFLARLILRNRVAFLIMLGGITVFMAYHAVYVKPSYEFPRILPENDPDYVDYKKFKEYFGEDGSVLVIGIKPESLSSEKNGFFSKEIFNDWYDLNAGIKKIDGIEEVLSLARIYNLEKNDSSGNFDLKPVVKRRPESQQEIDSVKNIILSLPVYEGLVYNPETNATLMLVTFDKNKLNTRDRIGMVENIKKSADEFGERHHLSMHYSGMPFIRTAITSKVMHEMVLFILLAFVVTSLILFFFFRSFRVVWFSLIVVVIGVIWSFGTLQLLDYRISLLTGLIPPLIIIIGVPNCILLLNKYQNEFQKHGNKMKALARMIERVGMTTFLANVTTSIGFGVFYLTDSKLLTEFGLVASINVMATYAISLIFIPIIFSYLKEPETRHIKHLQGKNINLVLTKIDYLVHHRRTIIYTVVLAVIGLSLFGATKINKVGFMVDDLPKKDPIYVDLKFFEANFHGILPFEILIDTKKKNGLFTDNAKTLYKIKAIEKVLAGCPEFSKPVSIVEFVKGAYQVYRGGSPKYFVLPPPTELKKLADLVSPKQKGGTFKSVVDTTKQVTHISVHVADIGSVRMEELLKFLRPKVDSIFSPDEYDVKLTGNSVTFAAGNEYLLTNLKQSVILAVILISIIMIGLFMSFRMITVSVLPCVIPLLITAGLMGFLGIALKPSSILIFSIAFGIASDGTIYFLTKYRQEIKSNPYSISKAVTKTIHETGVSMVYTAIILFAGFAIFSASSFGGTAALGILISLTLLISYLSNLILLPTILLTLEKRLITKAFLSEPLIQVYDEEEDIEFDNLEIQKDQTKE